MANLLSRYDYTLQAEDGMHVRFDSIYCENMNEAEIAVCKIARERGMKVVELFLRAAPKVREGS